MPARAGVRRRTVKRPASSDSASKPVKRRRVVRKAKPVGGTTTKRRVTRKPAARKSAARKPAARKPAARKRKVRRSA